MTPSIKRKLGNHESKIKDIVVEVMTFHRVQGTFKPYSLSLKRGKNLGDICEKSHFLLAMKIITDFLLTNVSG